MEGARGTGVSKSGVMPGVMRYSVKRMPANSVLSADRVPRRGLGTLLWGLVAVGGDRRG
jgi:hypothetical protein